MKLLLFVVLFIGLAVCGPADTYKSIVSQATQRIRTAVASSANKPAIGDILKWSTSFSLSRMPDLYGIISAFAPEVVGIIERMAQGGNRVVSVDYAGRRFYLGILDNKKVVVATSGVGMNNAAMTTQMLLDKYRVGQIIFSGIAGGVNPAHHIGDVVIAPKFGNNQHQRFMRPQSGTNGFEEFALDFPDNFYRLPSGQIPSFLRPSCLACDLSPVSTSSPSGFPLVSSGFSVTMEIETLVNGGDAYPVANQIVPQQFWFPVSSRLLAAAQQAIAGGIVLQRTGVDPLTGNNFTLDTQPVAVIGNAAVAGSTFLDNGEHRQQLFDAFGADFVDMESPAVAHVCASNQVEFLVIRSLSDLAGGGASLNEILTFIGFAARNSNAVLRAVLSKL